MLRDRLGVSERWACRVTGQHRSTQRREPVVAADDQALRAVLRTFACERKRWGYRRAHEHLLDEGWQVNRKRVQRVWREEGLRVPRRVRKRPPVGDGPCRTAVWVEVSTRGQGSSALPILDSGCRPDAPI